MDKRIKSEYVKKIVTAVDSLLAAFEKQAMEQALKATKNAPLKVASKSPKKLAAVRKVVAAATAKKTKRTLTLKKGRKTTGAELKPCPVTGILNKHRRFSYLMPEARTAENLAKFKGSAKKAAKAAKASI